VTRDAEPVPLSRPVRRNDLLHASNPSPRPQGPLGPDALAEELERLNYRRSPWDEWLDEYRGVPADGTVDPGDGGAASWEQDHPPTPPA